jgi:hypothetical protein
VAVLLGKATATGLRAFAGQAHHEKRDRAGKDACASPARGVSGTIQALGEKAFGPFKLDAPSDADQLGHVRMGVSLGQEQDKAPTSR